MSYCIPLFVGGKYLYHDDVIKWKHFPRNWSFVPGNSPVPVNSSHKGQWRGALMFSLLCAWINDWVNHREAGDLRHNHGHYDINVMHPWTVMGWWWNLLTPAIRLFKWTWSCCPVLHHYQIIWKESVSCPEYYETHHWVFTDKLVS